MTAIPKPLKMIDVSGGIVTIDAMGCQKAIAEEILIQRADYVLALKENQQKLYEMVEAIFNMGESRQFKKMLNRQTGHISDILRISMSFLRASQLSKM